MKVSYLLDILPSGVGNINQLSVGEVFKKVPIGLPPVLGCLGCIGGMGTVWDDVVCCGVWVGPVGMEK